MKEEIKALVAYRLGQAKESLEEAEILYRERKFRGAINRLYYACFYAILALLATKGLSSSKHSGVIALFHREFVKPGIFPKDEARTPNRLFDLRVKDDYKEFVTPSEEEVESLLPEAREFLKEVERVLEELYRQ
jgi:uncharacterized protein (UPF0332 family)